MAVEVARRSLWQRLSTFYRDVVAEMRKVTWPDQGQVRQATIAIIVFVLFIAAVITAIDLVLQLVLVRLLPSLFG